MSDDTILPPTVPCVYWESKESLTSWEFAIIPKGYSLSLQWNEDYRKNRQLSEEVGSVVGSVVPGKAAQTKKQAEEETKCTEQVNQQDTTQTLNGLRPSKINVGRGEKLRASK